jgi:hypothetical protein
MNTKLALSLCLVLCGFARAEDARSLITVRNLTSSSIDKSNGPGTMNTIITTVKFETETFGCAKPENFSVVNHISDPGNRVGLLSIYRVKPDDEKCPGQFTDLGRPIPVMQAISITLPERDSWVGNGQVLQNPTLVPNKIIH